MKVLSQSMADIISQYMKNFSFLIVVSSFWLILNNLAVSTLPRYLTLPRNEVAWDTWLAWNKRYAFKTARLLYIHVITKSPSDLIQTNSRFASPPRNCVSPIHFTLITVHCSLPDIRSPRTFLSPGPGHFTLYFDFIPTTVPYTGIYNPWPISNLSR